jgi:hypothetical protein
MSEKMMPKSTSFQEIIAEKVDASKRTIAATLTSVTIRPRARHLAIVHDTEYTMRLHGLIRSAELQENPPGSDQIEMIVQVQGVGPGQPRRLVIPYSTLLEDPSLDPDQVTGRGFEAEVAQDDEGRWIVRQIAFASKVLRPSE